MLKLWGILCVVALSVASKKSEASHHTVKLCSTVKDFRSAVTDILSSLALLYSPSDARYVSSVVMRLGRSKPTCYTEWRNRRTHAYGRLDSPVIGWHVSGLLIPSAAAALTAFDLWRHGHQAKGFLMEDTNAVYCKVYFIKRLSFFARKAGGVMGVKYTQEKRVFISPWVTLLFYLSSYL